MPDAFTAVNDGDPMQGENVQQIIDAWQGVASSGVPLSLTTVSSEGSYAADIKNEDTVNRRILRAQDADGTARLDYSGRQLKVTDLVLNHQATPSAPGASKMALYPKSDGLLYYRDGAAGSETAVGGQFANGTVGAPSAAFASDTDTGLYRIGADNVGIAAGGVKQVDISTTAVAFTGNISAVDGAFSDDVTISDDLAVSGLATVGETLGVTGITTATGGLRIPVSGGTVRLSGILINSTTWNPASMLENGNEGIDVTVTGAVVGDFAIASLSSLTTTQDMILSAYVRAADTVHVTLFNCAGTIDVGSGTVTVLVIQAATS